MERAENGHFYRRLWRPPGLRYLTWSCRHSLPLFGNSAIRDAFVSHLDACRTAHHFAVFSFVVMPTHVHLVMGLPEPKAARHTLVQVKGPFGRRVLARWCALKAPILRRLVDENGTRFFWQPGGGHDRTVRVSENIRAIFDYIHMNPVVAGLVSRPEDWAWSSVGTGCKLVVDRL